MGEEKMPDEMTTEEYQAELLGRIKERFEEVECLHMISSFLQQLSDEVRETAFINTDRTSACTFSLRVRL